MGDHIWVVEVKHKFPLGAANPGWRPCLGFGWNALYGPKIYGIWLTRKDARAAAKRIVNGKSYISVRYRAKKYVRE